MITSKAAAVRARLEHVARLRIGGDAAEMSRRAAAALLVGPRETLADVIADLDNGELAQILPEHRRDLIFAMGGDAVARRRLLAHVLPAEER